MGRPAPAGRDQADAALRAGSHRCAPSCTFILITPVDLRRTPPQQLRPRSALSSPIQQSARRFLDYSPSRTTPAQRPCEHYSASLQNLRQLTTDQTRLDGSRRDSSCPKPNENANENEKRERTGAEAAAVGEGATAVGVVDVEEVGEEGRPDAAGLESCRARRRNGRMSSASQLVCSRSSKTSGQSSKARRNHALLP